MIDIGLQELYKWENCQQILPAGSVKEPVLTFSVLSETPCTMASCK